MSLKKQYLKTKTVCKVTFTVPSAVAGVAKQVNLVGEFNNWDTQSLPMKKLKNGDFSVSLELERLKEYQFKYLIDGKEWQNDLEADKFAQNEFQGENSVVVV
ncbi:MAG: isoamylase early set domain-containing protein [Bacteroidota bacterium]|nr:isoamylase early set domain-containing protein [Bacteroidota bacterium]